MFRCSRTSQATVRGVIRTERPGSNGLRVHASVGSRVNSSNSARRQTILVTREQGKNGKLIRELQSANLDWIELPLIESVRRADSEKLPQVLVDRRFQWVVLTSPEAATVFLDGWRSAGQPKVSVAVVGAGTGEALRGTGLEIGFTPSKANAEAFAPELPMREGCGRAVLYPASARASTQLQDGLEQRGFQVERLNTYSTVPVSSLDSDALRAAEGADLITIGSPSAMKAWAQLADPRAVRRMPIACIGSTSAKAALSLGLTEVYFPEEPGIEGWMEAIQGALASSAQKSSVG